MISADFATIAGTEAARGTAGGRSVVADRPAGVAGGGGLGFNGGELLALALGGCLCNDLRYAAHEHGVDLEPFELRVELEVEDGRVLGARIVADGGPDLRRLLDGAVERSTIVAALVDGAPVTVEAA